MRLFLLGFMGCGKTTLGSLLAERLGVPFVDLDGCIEAGEGCSVAQIFAEMGEAGFRKIEQAHLRSLLDFGPAVVATGGGTPCFQDNLRWMNGAGATIYLRAAPELLCERLRSQRQNRPLLARLDEAELLPFVQKMLAERAPFYEKAQAVMPIGEADSPDFLAKNLAAWARKLTCSWPSGGGH